MAAKLARHIHRAALVRIHHVATMVHLIFQFKRWIICLAIEAFLLGSCLLVLSVLRASVLAW